MSHVLQLFRGRTDNRMQFCLTSPDSTGSSLPCKERAEILSAQACAVLLSTRVSNLCKFPRNGWPFLLLLPQAAGFCISPRMLPFMDLGKITGLQSFRLPDFFFFFFHTELPVSMAMNRMFCTKKHFKCHWGKVRNHTQLSTEQKSEMRC